MDLEVALCQECSYLFQSSAYCDEYDLKVSKLYEDYHMSDNFDFPRRDKKSVESLEFICKNIEASSSLDILEIGSDRGDFLFMLKERFSANIVGIEPNLKQLSMVPTVKSYFCKDSFSSKFDLVVLKHTLEHIKTPKPFLANVLDALRDGGYLYIEVPSVDVCMSNFLDDFTLEHVSYFSQYVLTNFLSDFNIVDVDNTHFLRVLVKKESGRFDKNQGKQNDIGSVELFFEKLKEALSSFKNELTKHTQNGFPVIFYGVGLYFRILFGMFSDELEKENCFFYDDNSGDDIERFSGISRFDKKNSGEQTLLVVTCSNDYASQDSMERRAIELFGQARVIKPFRSYYCNPLKDGKYEL